MYNFTPFDADFEKSYFEALSERFDSMKIEHASDPVTATNLPFADRIIHFYEDNLYDILIGTPEVHMKLIRSFNQAFPDVSVYNVEKAQKKIKKPKVFVRKKKPRPFCEIHFKSLFELTEKLFNYRAFSERKGLDEFGAYQLIKECKYRICPYCHQHHINYHFGENGLRLRPPLDHFFPESNYPWLSVSLYNLIPCCDQCNSRIKLAKDPFFYGILSPYSKQRYNMTLEWDAKKPIKNLTSDDITHQLKGADYHSQKFEAFFKLGVRYQWYQDELQDKIDQFNRYLDWPYDKLQLSVDLKTLLLGYEAEERHARAMGVYDSMLVDALIAHDIRYPSDK